MDYQWLSFGDILLKGLLTTLALTVFGSILAVALGLLIALCRTRWILNQFPPVQKAAIIYIELFRNTPLLCQVLFFYYGLHLSGFIAALLGLALYTSAYIAETFRSGFSTVSEDELHAGRLLGMSRLQVIRHILLPRSLESITGALGNQLMNLTKNSAIAYFVAVSDLTSVFEFLTTQTYHFLEFFLIVLGAYFGLCFLINLGSRKLEKHLLTRYDETRAIPPGRTLAWN